MVLRPPTRMEHVVPGDAAAATRQVNELDEAIDEAKVRLTSGRRRRSCVPTP